jgi:hypothetical protein
VRGDYRRASSVALSAMRYILKSNCAPENTINVKLVNDGLYLYLTKVTLQD